MIPYEGDDDDEWRRERQRQRLLCQFWMPENKNRNHVNIFQAPSDTRVMQVGFWIIFSISLLLSLSVFIFIFRSWSRKHFIWDKITRDHVLLTLYRMNNICITSRAHVMCGMWINVDFLLGSMFWRRWIFLFLLFKRFDGNTSNTKVEQKQWEFKRRKTIRISWKI